MDWTEQIGAMSEAWQTAQKQFADNWMQMATAQPSFTMPQAEQWRKLTEQNMQMWMANATPTAQMVTEQLTNSQQMLVNFLQMANEGWGKMMSQVAMGQDWQSAFDSYFTQLREQVSAPMTLAQDNAELWKLYNQQWQQFLQPWFGAFQPTSLAMGSNGSTILEVSKMYQTAYEQSFGKLFDAPGIGQNRELNAKLNAGFKAWQELQRANVDYQAILVQTGVKALEAFFKTSLEKMQANEPITTVSQFVTVWTEVADPLFIEAFKSSEYIEGQGAFLSAMMNYRVQTRQIIEEVMEALDMPTRSEIDEAHRNIYNQRKEIKAIKKSLNGGGVVSSNGESAKVVALEKTVASLKAELEELKQAVAEVAKPKRTTTTRKRTTKKADEAETASEATPQEETA